MELRGESRLAAGTGDDQEMGAGLGMRCARERE
jgi:hypothetical protein